MTVTFTTKLGLSQAAKGDLQGTWISAWNDDNSRTEERLATTYAGDPNGNVVGYFIGQRCFDTTNSKEYICTTTGDAATAVWQAAEALMLTYMLANIVPTGRLEITFAETADSGYIFVHGQSLGDTGSGADLEGTTYQDLYNHYWAQTNNQSVTVSSDRGATASADWAAGKTLTIPDIRDRAFFGVGTTWSLGETKGAETIAQANLPNVQLSVTGNAVGGNHTHTETSGVGFSNDFGPGGGLWAWRPGGGGDSPQLSMSGDLTLALSGAQTAALGSGTAFLPKGMGANLQVKL